MTPGERFEAEELAGWAETALWIDQLHPEAAENPAHAHETKLILKEVSA